ncbi:hypothetical protein F5B18DRAFT_614710 [Nemania serpens]|nr:hypothetical protein F5B18DRAFT_614710 [Nemania serpens]
MENPNTGPGKESRSPVSEHIQDLVQTNVAVNSGIAAIQLEDGTTYTFFYDQGTRPATLTYLESHHNKSSYSSSSITLENERKAVTSDTVHVLAACLSDKDIYVFYADKNYNVHQVNFNLDANTWKKGNYANGVTNSIAKNTGISVMASPVLRVHFVDSEDAMSISEAYFTSGTWSVRKISNV